MNTPIMRKSVAYTIAEVRDGKRCGALVCMGHKGGVSCFERAHFYVFGDKIGTFGCRIGASLFDSLRTLSSSLNYDIRTKIEAKFRGFHAFLRDSVATLRLVEVDDAHFRSGCADQ